MREGYDRHDLSGHQLGLTFALCRSSRHEDSAGHKGEIKAGGVQWMCAVSCYAHRPPEYSLC